MTKDTTIPAASAGQAGLFDNWFDEIETGVRARVRGFIETMLEEELDEALSRPRYGRRKPEAPDSEPVVAGHRHGHRKRTLTGTFGKTDIDVPRARGSPARTARPANGKARPCGPTSAAPRRPTL